MRQAITRPSLVFLLVLIAWLLGTAWPIFRLGAFINVLLCLAVLIGYFVRRSAVLLTSLLCLVSGVVASSYYQLYWQSITPSIDYTIVQTLDLTILDEPTKNNDYVTYQARAPTGWNVRLLMKRNQVIAPGTIVTVVGRLLSIAAPGDETVFRRAAKDKIFARLNFPTVVAERPARLNAWERFIINSRKLFGLTTSRLFTEPSGALFAGIVVGLKTNLPPELIDNFRIAGLSHIIAVSGFNVTIVMGLFTRFSQRFGRWWQFWLSWLAIIFFIVFTGATASVVRAGILAGLLVFAHTLSRKASIPHLLVLIAVIMCIINPLVLLYDIGFQLSFAALIGLVLFATPFANRLAIWHWPMWLAETVASTLAAELTTLPIIIYNFGSLSPYGLLANTLIGPLIPPLTAFGIPLVLLVAVFPFLAWLSYPFDIALRYIMIVVREIATLPWANATAPPLSWFVWAGYSFFLFALYRHLNDQ